MMDAKLEARLNEDLDGTLAPEEASRLRRTLAVDPEAKAYHEDLTRLGRILAEVGTVNPPTEMKTNILHAVRELPIPGAGIRRLVSPHRRPWSEALLGFFRGPGYARVAFVFGAGFAVGLIVFALAGPGPRPEASRITGTMAPISPPPGLTPVAARSFDLEDAKGTLESRAGAGESWLTVSLDAGAARFEITLGEGIRPLGVDRDPGSEGSVSLGRNRVVIDAVTPGRIVIRLATPRSGGPAEAVVRVTGEGRAVEEKLPLRPF